MIEEMRAVRVVILATAARKVRGAVPDSSYLAAIRAIDTELARR